MTDQTKEAWTPGPWEAAVRHSEDMVDVWWVKHKINYPICKVSKEANAHLIAAAPEMYAALRGLLDDLTALMGGSEGVAGLHLNGDLAPWSELTPGGQCEHLGFINDAYDALAKARGEL